MFFYLAQAFVCSLSGYCKGRRITNELFHHQSVGIGIETWQDQVGPGRTVDCQAVPSRVSYAMIKQTKQDRGGQDRAGSGADAGPAESGAGPAS